MNAIPSLYLSATLAIALPTAALTLALSLPEQPGLPAVTPFGLVDLVIVQVILGFPLAWVVSAKIPRSQTITKIAWGLTALALLLTFTLGAAVGTFLDTASHFESFISRHFVRVFWCLLLETTCLLSFNPQFRQTSAIAWILAILTAIGLPWLYTQSRIAAEAQGVEEFLERGQYVRAASSLDPLLAVDPDLSIAGERASKFRATLAGEIRRLQAEVRQNTAPGGRLRLARTLALLDRLPESLQILNQLPDDPNAQILLGSVLQDQRHFQASDEAFLRARGLLNKQNVEQRRQILDGMAYNARERGDPKAAERLYLEAIESIPEQRAYYHFQLGRHYHLGNRPGAALRHLRQATDLDPERYQIPTQKLIRQIHRDTPGCLLFTPSRQTTP